MKIIFKISILLLQCSFIHSYRVFLLPNLLKLNPFYRELSEEMVLDSTSLELPSSAAKQTPEGKYF